MKYLREFNNHSSYESFTGTSEFILPNVSKCVQEDEVHFNPWTEPIETRVVAKFNVTDTSNPTRIGFNEYISGFSSIEIDGVVQPSVVSAYTFSTTGEHTVKYTLTDPTSIGDYAFITCDKLTSVVIPNSVTSIGECAFKSCSSLTGVIIPDSVTSIGMSAFMESINLTNVIIGNGITYINMQLFASCHSLTNINIPSSVTGIGYNSFSDCYSLTSIDIPSGVTSIGQYAFRNCSGLTSMEIPNGVTSIGNYAFSGCNSFTSVTINASTPPTLNGGAAFDNTNNCPIYVPCDSVDTYKAATNWSTLANRIQGNCYDYVEIAGIKWATMNVGATAVTDTGLYFQWGDISGYTAAQCGSGEGQKYFGWKDYKYCSGAGTSSSAMTKYNSTDGKTVLDLSDDAARVNLGGDWRMPTPAEYAALGNAVNTALTADYQGSGVAGLVCTDKTDSSKVLFFPAAGYCYNGTLVGSGGYYWSSSVYSSDVQRAYILHFSSSDVHWQNIGYRYRGYAVRGVLDE